VEILESSVLDRFLQRRFPPSPDGPNLDGAASFVGLGYERYAKLIYPFIEDLSPEQEWSSHYANYSAEWLRISDSYIE
jgi:hypothetical protein